MLITSGLLGVLIGYGAAMKTSSQGTWQVLIRNFTMITASKQWKKMQFYWSISGNTTVLCHLRVFPVVCGRCDVFRPIYNFRCNCSVLGVFMIKLVATTSVFAVTIEQQEINRKQVIAFFVSPTFPFAATSNTPTGCNNTSLSHVLTPSIYHKSHTITEHISVSRTTRSSLKYP